MVLNRDDVEQAAAAPKKLSRWHLLTMAISGIIGSGWLLAIPATGSLYQGNWVTPIVSWLVAAALLALLAVVVIRLATARPVSGGLVRWPTESTGRAVGTIIGAGLIVVYSGNPPTAAAAVVQVFDGNFWFGENTLVECVDGAVSLKLPGLLIAIALLTVLFVINLFGLQLVARVNTAITVVKVAVPILIAIGLATYLVAAGGGEQLHFQPFCREDSSAPAFPVVDGLVTTGIIFSFTGFQGPVDHAGRAERGQIRFAVLGGLAVTACIYVALQLGYFHAAANGWPIASAQNGVGGQWLVWLMLMSMVFSPLATAMVFFSFTGAGLKASGDERLVIVPFFDVRKVARDAPWGALAWGYFTGVVLLIGFGGWAEIATAKTVIFLFIYSYAAIAYTAFRLRASPVEKEAKYPASLRVVGPLSVGVATTLAFFSGFDKLFPSYVFFLALGFLMVVSRLNSFDQRFFSDHLPRAWWLLGYFLVLLALSGLSTWLEASYAEQWRSVAFAWQGGLGLLAFGLGIAAYYVGVRESLKHQDYLDEQDRESARA